MRAARQPPNQIFYTSKYLHHKKSDKNSAELTDKLLKDPKGTKFLLENKNQKKL